MEAFLTSYELPFAPFRELLSTTNSLVAGSAPLALYLQQNNVEPGFEPGDIDIWVEDTNELIALHGNYRQYGNYYLFSNFLIQNGFNVACKYEPKETDYDNLHNITHILSFENRKGKKIQIILLKEKNIPIYIAKHFDLSICMSWWNPIDNIFDTMNESITLAKKMYHYPSRNQAREQERIEKYQARGFQLLETPCSSINLQDPREHLEALEGKTAFDLFDYEEIDAAAFLRESSWHILVRVGEQFHAFHRKVLYAYLREHKYSYYELHHFFDTPYKQTISNDACAWFLWADYSIVELRPSYTFTVGNDTKSVFDCHFYTTQQWSSGEPAGLVCTPPAEESVRTIPYWAMMEADVPAYYPEGWVDS